MSVDGTNEYHNFDRAGQRWQRQGVGDGAKARLGRGSKGRAWVMKKRQGMCSKGEAGRGLRSKSGQRAAMGPGHGQRVRGRAWETRQRRAVGIEAEARFER